MRKKYSLLLLTLILISSASAQDFAAFNDIQNDFWVFEAGLKKKVEFNTIDDFQVGGNSVGYVDNNGRFKIFSKGKIIDTRLSDPTGFDNTDYFLSVSIGEQLKAFHDGQLNNVTNWALNYKVGDSVIAYNDELKSNFMVYYKDRNYVCENAVVGDGLSHYWVGDNIVAYIDNANFLKAFYKGEVYELLFNVPLNSIKISSNTIAYVNANTETFEAFYKGEFYTLSEFQPEFFHVGDDLVAYYTNNNQFKIFYKGEIYDIGVFVPQNIEVKDNLVVFEQDNHFNVFYLGKVHTLETYIPPAYQVDYHSLVYLDMYGKLRLFSKGRIEEVTWEPVNDYDLNMDAILFQTANRSTRVYYKGKIY